jgi:hypothetical protein
MNRNTPTYVRVFTNSEIGAFRYKISEYMAYQCDHINLTNFTFPLYSCVDFDYLWLILSGQLVSGQIGF